MPTLTVSQQTDERSLGLYRVRCGRRTGLAIVVPTFMVNLGMRPTDQQIREDANREWPDARITNSTPVVWKV